ncbi:MAG: hypothetical protein HY904_05835 [Deltaproteobacteria bacterium]|nr:hypothetical protein [Deltaproteobacteria bacterium]
MTAFAPLLYSLLAAAAAEDVPLEQDTPGAWEPTAWRLLRENRESTQAHARATRDRPEDTVRKTHVDILEGGGNAGLRAAWRLAGENAGTAAAEGRASVTDLPAISGRIGEDRAATSVRVAREFPAAWRQARARWAAAHAVNQLDLSVLRADLADLSLRADGAVVAVLLWAAGVVEDLSRDVAGAESGIHGWTVHQTRDAWDGMSRRAPRLFAAGVHGSADILRALGPAARDQVLSGGADARRAWALTTEGTGATATAVLPETRRAWRNTSRRSRALAGWLLAHPVEPAARIPGMVTAFHAWSVREGWERGLKAGFHSASEAWEAGDTGMAVAWSAGALGRGAGHVALEVAMLPPLVLGTAAATLFLATGGWTTVAMMGLGGVVLAGAALGAGTLATATLASAGTALTGLAAGLGVARGGLLLAGGTAAAASTLAFVSLGSAGAGAVHSARLVLVPAAGFTSAAAVRGFQAAASAATWSGAAVAVTAIRGGQGAYYVLRPFPAVVAAGARAGAAGLAGATDVAVGAPLGIAVDAAGHALRTTGALVEHPARSAAHAALAAAHATRGTARAGFLGGRGLAIAAVEGSVEALATGAFAVAAAGAGAGVGGTWLVRALNIPLHRAWAESRRDETQTVLAALQEQGVAEDGKLAVMRVHWWGADSGRVRFFVTRGGTGAERWYFERGVDPHSCEVTYRGTQRDPARRLLGTPADWTAPLHTGLYERTCVERRAGATQVALSR